jgi:hypothetical protein
LARESGRPPAGVRGVHRAFTLIFVGAGSIIATQGHDLTAIALGRPVDRRAMNPARAFGPQLVQNVWSDGWVYYLGPALGAVLAALAYEWLYLRPLAPEPVGPPETGVEEPAPGRAATE